MPDVTRFLSVLRQHFGAKNDKELAGHLGVSSGKLSEWKSGKLSVTLTAVRKMSAKTGISQRMLLDWLEPTAATGVQGITKTVRPPARARPGSLRVVSSRGPADGPKKKARPA